MVSVPLTLSLVEGWALVGSDVVVIETLQVEEVQAVVGAVAGDQLPPVAQLDPLPPAQP
jgi:hypothetical protein